MDAFISHSSKDDEIARRLERELESDGLDVWTDDSEIRFGVLLGPELRDAILGARVLVLLWSEAAAASRWVNSEWLMALHQDRFILPCTLDATALPQCLATSVFLDVRRAGAEAGARLARGIRQAGGGPTPLAPLIRAEAPELAGAIVAIAEAQQAMNEQLGLRDLDAAAGLQRELDAAMAAVRERWKLDPMIVNLDGYHLKNAYMLAHWDAIQAGRAPADDLLDASERRFFETLALDPTDPSALNGLGSVLFFERELDAAELFVRAAISAARKQGMAGYPAAEHDLEQLQRFRG